MSIPTIWAKSSGAAAAPRLRCARWSPASAAGGSASTWWTPTSSKLRMELVVGRVVKAHGVSGELVVEVRTDDPDNRFAAGHTLTAKPPTGGPSREYFVEPSRAHGARLLVRLAGVLDRDAADAMR